MRWAVLLLIPLLLSGCQAGQPRQMAEEGLEASLPALLATLGSIFGPVGAFAGGFVGALWIKATDGQLAVEAQQDRQDDQVARLFGVEDAKQSEEFQQWLAEQATQQATPLVIKGMLLLVVLYLLNHLQRWYRRRKAEKWEYEDDTE